MNSLLGDIRAILNCSLLSHSMVVSFTVIYSGNIFFCSSVILGNSSL
jgi:hypothetical protein